MAIARAMQHALGAGRQSTGAKSDLQCRRLLRQITSPPVSEPAEPRQLELTHADGGRHDSHRDDQQQDRPKKVASDLSGRGIPSGNPVLDKGSGRVGRLRYQALKGHVGVMAGPDAQQKANGLDAPAFQRPLPNGVKVIAVPRQFRLGSLLRALFRSGRPQRMVTSGYLVSTVKAFGPDGRSVPSGRQATCFPGHADPFRGFSPRKR